MKLISHHIKSKSNNDKITKKKKYEGIVGAGLA